MRQQHYKKIIILLILLTTLPFLILFNQVNFNLINTNFNSFGMKFLSVSANICGFIGAILLIWQFILGIRYIAKVFSPDILGINKIHNLIGKYGIILILIHPLLETYTYLDKFFWVILPNISSNLELHVTLGRIALILFLIIWITSAIIRSKLNFRPWQYLHYISYPLIFLVFIHSLDIGTFIERFPFLKAIWYCLLIIFIILLQYRLYMFSGKGKTKYKVINNIKAGTDINIITLAPIKKLLIPKVGQYFYLQLKNFQEAHPFSVMEFDEETKQITFAIKIIGRFSKEIGKLTVDSIINIDGPYGVFTLEAQNADPKVIIAGGIGVTPFIDLVKKFGTSETIFLNANRFLDDIIQRDELISKLGNNYYDFISRENTKEDHIINSRLTSELFQKIVSKEKLHINKYFLCGGKEFIKASIEVLSSLGVEKSKIFLEDFGT
jgi:predicted ferric reductase